MNEIKAVIFDWGGVLIYDPMPEMMAYCSNKLNITKEKLIKIYNQFACDFQTDRIPEERLWNKIATQLGINHITVDSLWMDAFKLVYRPNGKIFVLLKELKDRGYKTGLLSNTERKVMEYYKQLNYNMIDTAVFSCAEGITKPDKRIYEIILNRMKVTAHETIFIDDRSENIFAAEQLGMKAILFRNYHQLIKALVKLGVNLD